MIAFIVVTLAAVLLMILVWRWVVLQRRNRQQGDSYAGKSTYSGVVSKEKRENKS
jgi:hypothetical protein